MDAPARREAFLAHATRVLRRVLQERWRGVDFEVTPRPSASWTRFDVHWTDGPTRLLVTQVAEATIAAIDGEGATPHLEVSTRRQLSEQGVRTALLMVADDPPAEWFLPNGDVGWMRFSIADQHRLMADFLLPERPISAHHLAALLANRIDLSFALSHRR